MLQLVLNVELEHQLVQYLVQLQLQQLVMHHIVYQEEYVHVLLQWDQVLMDYHVEHVHLIVQVVHQLIHVPHV